MRIKVKECFRLLCIPLSGHHLLLPLLLFDAEKLKGTDQSLVVSSVTLRRRDLWRPCSLCHAHCCVCRGHAPGLFPSSFLHELLCLEMKAHFISHACEEAQKHGENIKTGAMGWMFFLWFRRRFPLCQSFTLTTNRESSVPSHWYFRAFKFKTREISHWFSKTLLLSLFAIFASATFVPRSEL